MQRPCFPNLFNQADGATAPEYAVLAGLLGLAVLGGANQLGSSTEARFDDTAEILAESAAAARANGSIVNGLVKSASFEGYTQRNMRRVFKRMRAWSSSQGFEAWGTGYLGVAASHGENFLELDVENGGEIDRIWQNIETDAAQKYIIQFDMHQRGDTLESVENVEVGVVADVFLVIR